jgi:hypothetical protein
MRTCNECRHPLPLSEFHRGQYKCKRCSSAVVNAYRKARRRRDDAFRRHLNRMTADWQRRTPEAQRAKASRHYFRHKDAMTDSWIRSNIRRKFGPVKVTAEMMDAARQRISTVRSLKLARLADFLNGNKT